MKIFKILTIVAAISVFAACSKEGGTGSKECSHKWEEGSCSVCGLECSHIWEEGCCSVCGLVCSHKWEEGCCSVCGLVCSHIWEEKYCSICGVSQLTANPWRMMVFCGKTAEVDLYIDFKSDNTFLMLQRSGAVGYAEYAGSYSIDKAQSVVSGVYSDGESWACDYRFSFNEEGALVLESLTENPEVAVFVASEMPNDPSSQTKACGVAVEDVRPL